jgi:DoxX-like family
MMSHTTLYKSFLHPVKKIVPIIFVSGYLKKIIMKKIRIFYWITTGLFLLLMLFSSVSSLLAPAPAEAFFKNLNMPSYLISFLSVAKLLGVIAILVPGYPRLKEWAYAGLMFDLIGAMYCNYASGKTTGEWLPIIIFIALGFTSYFLYHKKTAVLPR